MYFFGLVFEKNSIIWKLFFSFIINFNMLEWGGFFCLRSFKIDKILFKNGKLRVKIAVILDIFIVRKVSVFIYYVNVLD